MPGTTPIRTLDQPPRPSSTLETPEAAYRRGYHEAMKAAVEALEAGGYNRNMMLDWLETVRRWRLRSNPYRPDPGGPDPMPATGVERLGRIARDTAPFPADVAGHTARSPRRVS